MVTDVLVVGARPVGLVAACELVRRGVRVRIVDKLAAPTTESRAILAHARSLARLIAQIDGPTAEPTLDALQRIVDQRAGGGIRITESHWLTNFEIHHAQVPAYRHGRVFLAGDAAHVHSPAGGQGMNTGIQDAANLAWKLASPVDGRGGDRLLDSFQAERHPVAAAARYGFESGGRAVIRPDGYLGLVGDLDADADAYFAQLLG